MKEQDLNVAAFLKEVWSAKRWVLVGVFVCCVCAAMLHVISIPRYEGRMMIGPAQGGEIFAQRMNNAQSVDGVRVQGGGGSDVSASQVNFTRFEAIYDGVSVAEILLRDSQFVDALANDRAFVFSKGARDLDAAMLAAYIGDRVWFDAFGETALREMKYRHANAGSAAYMLQKIHRVSDQLIRGDIRNAVEERIAYLERMIARSMNPDQRRAMTHLLLEEERLRMMVSMDAPVAAQVIEKASASVKPVWPDLYVLYIGFAVLGAFAGYVAHSIRSILKEDASIVKKRVSYRDWANNRKRANDEGRIMSSVKNAAEK